MTGGPKGLHSRFVKICITKRLMTSGTANPAMCTHQSAEATSGEYGTRAAIDKYTRLEVMISLPASLLTVIHIRLSESVFRVRTP